MIWAPSFVGQTTGRLGKRRLWHGREWRGCKDADIPVLVNYLFKTYGPPKAATPPRLQQLLLAVAVAAPADNKRLNKGTGAEIDIAGFSYLNYR